MSKAVIVTSLLVMLLYDVSVTNMTDKLQIYYTQHNTLVMGI
jgi:hypothetical protein